MALGAEKVVGRRIGMQSHTLWSEVLEIVEEARSAQVDLLLTLGAGSLTDGAKIIALVSLSLFFFNWSCPTLGW
jgi:alcohol dehydrogenase class IV